MATPDSLNSLLRVASQLLDQAAGQIRDVPLHPARENISHIGRALAEIFEVQRRIYADRPDLTPEYLKEESPDPEANRRLTQAMCDALDREDAGDYLAGIAILEAFIATETSEFHKDIAAGEIDRLRELDQDARSM